MNKNVIINYRLLIIDYFLGSLLKNHPINIINKTYYFVF
jgi:hypothetical protein